MAGNRPQPGRARAGVAGVSENVRFQRNQLLLESDFFNFPDACIANVQDWLDYRQELRDVPDQPGFPKKIIWPQRPEVIKE